MWIWKVNFKFISTLKKTPLFLEKIGNEKREMVNVGFLSLPLNAMETYKMYKLAT